MLYLENRIIFFLKKNRNPQEILSVAKKEGAIWSEAQIKVSKFTEEALELSIELYKRMLH